MRASRRGRGVSAVWRRPVRSPGTEPEGVAPLSLPTSLIAGVVLGICLATHLVLLPKLLVTTRA